VLRSDRLGNCHVGIIPKAFTLDEDMEDGLGAEVGLVSVSREDNRGDGSLIEAFKEGVVHLLKRDGLYTRMPNDLGHKPDNGLERVLLDRLLQHPSDTIGVHHVTVPIRVSVSEDRTGVRCEGPHGQQGISTFRFGAAGTRFGGSRTRAPTSRDAFAREVTKGEGKWGLEGTMPGHCCCEAADGVEKETERCESDHNPRDCLAEEEEMVRKAGTEENERRLEHQWQAIHYEVETPSIHSVHLQFPVPDRLDG
jgi:hypothetical protein